MNKRTCLVQTLFDGFYVEPELYTYIIQLKQEKKTLETENVQLKERVEQQNRIIKKLINI